MSLLWPALLWPFALPCHYCTAGWMGGMSCLTREVGRGEGEGEVTGEDRRVGVCMFVYVWDCLGSVAACWPGHPSDRVHPSKPHSLPSPPSPPKAHQPDSARPGISTLISHLWRPNELRLLIHLWDPTDYQTGGDHLSMARGGIYTADLAAKKGGIKMEYGRGKNRKEKESNQQLWNATLFAATSTAVCKDDIYSWKVGWFYASVQMPIYLSLCPLVKTAWGGKPWGVIIFSLSTVTC